MRVNRRFIIFSISLFGAAITSVLSGGEYLSAQTALEGHTDYVQYVAFFPDGKTLLSGAEDNTIRLWDVVNERELSIWQKTPEFDAAPSTRILRLSDDGLLLARAGAAQGSAELWDVKKVARIRTIQAHQRPVTGIAISGDGTVLVTFSEDECKVWDATKGKQLLSLKAPNLYSFRAAAVTSDGKVFSVATSDKKISLFDISSGKQLSGFDGGPGQIHSLSFSSDGKLLASGSDGTPDITVHVWNLVDNSLIEGVLGSDQYAHSVAFSHDAHFLASGGLTVRVWDMTNHKLINEFNGHEGPVTSVAFSPDGSVLASGSEDKRVGLWKITSSNK